MKPPPRTRSFAHRPPPASEQTFTCVNCGKEVSTVAFGTMNRNHCPFCLHSRHVAENRKQDDRTSTCLGIMEPIAISAQRDGEWSLVHRCASCGNIKTNRIAGDDDTLLLMTLALRPLERLPFPLDQVLFEAGKNTISKVAAVATGRSAEVGSELLQ